MNGHRRKTKRPKGLGRRLVFTSGGRSRVWGLQPCRRHAALEALGVQLLREDREEETW